jgi:putative transposase
MVRKHRYFAPGCPLHVIQRGNNRTPIFHGDDDRWRYLEYLIDTSDRYGCAVHCYVLMGNHIHMLVTPGDEHALAKTMQSLNIRYVLQFNKRHERTGGLWDGRYMAKQVNTDGYLKICYQYIELNPVRAGLCKQPEEFSWSSYLHHAYGEMNSVVTQHSGYLELGATEDERQERYRGWFRQRLSEQQLEQIRAAPEKIQSLKSPIKSGV